jgi:short-subunit dehydrogenase
MSEGADSFFAGTTALVTGASSGLGEEFARQLAARGCNLVLTARSEAKLMELCAELHTQHGIAAEAVALDLGAPGGAARLVGRVEMRLGSVPIDHLISNAGFGTAGDLADSDAERQAEMVRLNCEALTHLSACYIRGMVARKKGGILHVASVAGMQPVPFMATYGATKAYVLSFSAALSEEARPHGVHVSALCPGPVETGFQVVTGAPIAPSQKRAVLTAAETVRQGLDAYRQNRAVFIPGALNRVGALGVKFLPRGLVVRTVGKMMRARTT